MIEDILRRAAAAFQLGDRRRGWAFLHAALRAATDPQTRVIILQSMSCRAQAEQRFALADRLAERAASLVPDRAAAWIVAADAALLAGHPRRAKRFFLRAKGAPVTAASSSALISDEELAEAILDAGEGVTIETVGDAAARIEDAIARREES